MNRTVLAISSGPPGRRLIAACMLGLICLAGCSSGDLADIDPAWVLDEHGNPDFKPADFDQAIGALKSTFGEVAALPTPESSAESRKFRQIIRWLPEYAADTPIQRAGWEDLAARAGRIESAARQPGFFAQDRAEAFRRELDALTALIPPDLVYRKYSTRPARGEDASAERSGTSQPEPPEAENEPPKNDTPQSAIAGKGSEPKGGER